VDLPVREKLPHTIPQWVADGSWFFITINCVPPGKNQLCRADTGDAVLAAMKFNHERFVWHCRLCLLMPDHLHAIMAFPREPGMATTIKNWKKFVAGKHGIAWQRDFFDHRLRDHHELEEKTSYIPFQPAPNFFPGRCPYIGNFVLFLDSSTSTTVVFLPVMSGTKITHLGNWPIHGD
jgi:putative transposase